MVLRQPIVVVLGHVDHGKTTLLDKLRGTTVAKREPGQITQLIGASLLPRETVEQITGPLLKQFHFELKVPGLLLIDTPGHETFSNLRRRGGSAADIAILVIDVTKGVEPQTVESINILKTRKTPFIIAANKIDAIRGWKSEPDMTFVESLKSQFPEIQTELDNRVYTIMGTLSRLGFRAERFDRIADFKGTAAIVPLSAKTGEGIPELLATLTGLTQAYLFNELEITSGPARGTVLEVKDEPGLGTTINAIIFDGALKVDDTIVLGGRDAPIVTEVRAILVPKPLDEIRDPRDRFTSVKRVTAASGVKLAAPKLESALAGSPLYAVPKGKHTREYVRMIEDEVEKLRVKTETSGVVLKTDTLGSLEAVTESLSRHGIQIRLADIGDVSKREIVEVETFRQEDRLLAVILAFNVKVLPDAEEEAATAGIPIFKSDVIYHLLEDYLRWSDEQRTSGVKAELDLLVRPCKARIMQGFIFRRSNPAIVGVEILSGRLKAKSPVITKAGRRLGEVQKMQDKGADVDEAKVGMQVAVSIEDGVVGRNIDEGDLIYADVPERHLKTLSTKFPGELTESDHETIKELIEIKRRENPVWGF
ncbi:MAG TPA: translation initiation factor IF-2 [Candidatus Saccharimonadales bacterium]|nr:translation initiation factor IF-2 [Candidatus Saccharimonadales bacterium]